MSQNPLGFFGVLDCRIAVAGFRVRGSGTFGQGRGIRHRVAGGRTTLPALPVVVAPAGKQHRPGAGGYEIGGVAERTARERRAPEQATPTAVLMLGPLEACNRRGPRSTENQRQAPRRRGRSGRTGIEDRRQHHWNPRAGYAALAGAVKGRVGGAALAGLLTRPPAGMSPRLEDVRPLQGKTPHSGGGWRGSLAVKPAAWDRLKQAHGVIHRQTAERHSAWLRVTSKGSKIALRRSEA